MRKTGTNPNNPVELLGLLLHGRIHELGLVQLLGHHGYVIRQLVLGLLQLRQLQVELVNGGVVLRKPCRQLHLGHLELFSTGNSLLLVFLPPHLAVIHSLFQLPGKILLLGNLLVQVLPKTT